jgi:hypothetical protein
VLIIISLYEATHGLRLDEGVHMLGCGVFMNGLLHLGRSLGDGFERTHTTHILLVSREFWLLVLEYLIILGFGDWVECLL